ncbi:hypothetical protein AGMMS49940_05810 [Spirochaetia bacterium]|nr:hypothetical protein AGMMS49940_05810 [Spirochaetia bacterium]
MNKDFWNLLQPRLRNESEPVLQAIGKWGCYLLSIAEISGVVEERWWALIELYNRCLYHGWIDKECTILTPEAGPAILKHLTGNQWTLEKIDSENPILPPLKPVTEVIYKYHAFSGVGYHYKTLLIDTEVERARTLCGFRIYTRVT